jgi:hypothetical protein
VNLYKILVESFQLLRGEPRFFVPRLISTGISTIWFILVFDNYFLKIANLQLSAIELVAYLVSGPFIVFLGVFVSIMLAYMVENGPNLEESFFYTVNRFKSLLGVTLGVMLLGFLVSIPVFAGVIFLPVFGMRFLLATAAFSLLLFLASSFAIYFLPIAVVENNGVLSSLKDSMRSSRQNSREVAVMLLFSLALLGFAGMVQGALQALGYVAFALSRFISALTTTYLFVVSPKMYFYSED